MADLFDDKIFRQCCYMKNMNLLTMKEYIYELKWDGIRCVAYIEPKSVTLQNKRYKDITAIYPELLDMCKCVKKRTILDGELVVLTNGKPDFYTLQKRSLMGANLKLVLQQRRIPYNL